MSEGAEEDARPKPSSGSRSIAAAKVFISYASQDKSVADTVVAALEHAGIACWFAPRDVMAGAFYADAIVHAIDSASSLVLILSKQGSHSHHVLRELERAASKRHRVITLKIDTTPLPAAFEYFLNTSQWLDASGGNPERQFPKLIDSLRGLRTDVSHTAESAKSIEAPTYPARKAIVGALTIFVMTGFAYVLVEKPWHWSGRAHPQPSNANPTLSAPPAAPPAAFTPRPHSIAVLPFVNMSGDPKQEYFSDGITEELLNSLSRLNNLSVMARTSSFSFKGQNVDVLTIAHKLNVGTILEGSVRRGGNTVRITVQLINGVTGFHMWSQTYDRRSTDILKVQAEVATSVARQLQGTLMGDDTEKLELGSTNNPEAYEAYLRGVEVLSNWDSGNAGLLAALEAFNQAVEMDPNYALAYAMRATVFQNMATFLAKPGEISSLANQALEAAEHAVLLSPDLGEAHLALAKIRAYLQLNFANAAPEFDRALELSPGSAHVQRGFAGFASKLGHAESAIIAARRAVDLDPRNVEVHIGLGQVLVRTRRYREALLAFRAAEVLRPNSRFTNANISDALLADGQTEQARQLCESAAAAMDEDDRHGCLAVVYHRIERQHEAEVEVQKLLMLLRGRDPVGIAGTYAELGNAAAALAWLSKAEQLRDPGLQSLKVYWGFDSIRSDAKFKAVLARMNFPP
jgi:TolB-like protein